ncbi:MAG: hypothetical protein QNJ98_18550 [Planctomycetota bacterium]|nr:hypothetical protein [Planctomycetota bacterium]
MSDLPRTDAAGLRARLDALADRGRAHIEGARRRRGLAAAVKRLLPMLLVVPVLVFGIQVTQMLHGTARWDVNGWVVLGVMGLFAAAWMLGEHLLFDRAAPSRRAALGLFDTEGRFADRLNAADAFLDEPAPGAFMQAAIEDAEAFVQQANTVRLPAQAATFPPASDVLRYVGAALLLCLFVGLVGEPTTAGLATVDEGAITADADGARDSGAPPPPNDPVRDPTPKAADPETERPRDGSSDAKEMKRAPAELDEDAKKTEGRTSAGQASDAESTSGANDARGAPTNQGPSAKSGKKKKPKATKKPLDKKPAEAKKQEPKQMDADPSGSTSGRGSSKGSNKNPVKTDWKSKDQVDPDEEDEIEDDEEVEDEESESEARGGMQPNLRDRKPPVSRDLTIGFGNQPSPDANGRGGPSEQKKSRGTASLVLGVPIPDRVKGQPNPGKTKVTQERVEPRRETAKPVAAGARTPRSTPIGRVAEPSFAPWMRDLIRSYFLTLRSKAPTKRSP